MLNSCFQQALILTGPTGSGKTPLGLELAQRQGLEIISMDSMALYRGMDIGTAKPSVIQRQQLHHHLVDVLDPWESGSVAWWLEQAAECCRDIAQRGKRALFVGGTPLYLKALLRGLFPGPGAAEPIRQRLEEDAKILGIAALHERLFRADPVTATRVHPNDLRRIVRALEVLELTGQPISDWQQQWQGERRASSASPGSPTGAVPIHPPQASTNEPEASATAGVAAPRAVWLDVPRAELYARINRRVQQMFAAGLVEEVKRLRDLDRPLSREANQALGYKEIFAYLDGRTSLEETLVLVQRRSRNFAKRQISWFRHLPEVRPIQPGVTCGELTAGLLGATMEHRSVATSPPWML